MAHKTQIIEQRRLDNGQFSLIFRCCEEAKTDTPLVLNAEAFLPENAEKMQSSLAEAHKATAALHQADTDGQVAAAALVGHEVQHQ